MYNFILLKTKGYAIVPLPETSSLVPLNPQELELWVSETVKRMDGAAPPESVAEARALLELHHETKVSWWHRRADRYDCSGIWPICCQGPVYSSYFQYILTYRIFNKVFLLCIRQANKKADHLTESNNHCPWTFITYVERFSKVLTTFKVGFFGKDRRGGSHRPPRSQDESRKLNQLPFFYFLWGHGIFFIYGTSHPLPPDPKLGLQSLYM